MRKNAKLFVLCLALLTVCLALTPFAADFKKVAQYSGSFTDVPETQWYAKEVAAAYELGFVNGKSDTIFDPNGTMTVAEAVTVASRMHASYNGKTIPTVNGAKWYDMYIQYALDNGIMEAGYFNSLDRTVRRYEIATLIANALPASHFAAKNDVTAIPDVNEKEEYADILLMLYKAGIVMGSDDYGTFFPTNPIKRSEFSAIINRAALPENRVSGTLTPMPERKEAYYLIDNYNMTSQARQRTRLASGWNYDNRNESSIIKDDTVQAAINDVSDKHYAAINRDFEVQTKGVMTFATAYTISGNTKDGIRFYFTDSDGKSVVEFITKNGVYSAVSGGNTYKGSVEATGSTHFLKAVMDLDNKKGSLIVDGVKSCDFEIAPFKDFARINLSSTVEDKISLAVSRCHLYMNYAVNEDFTADAYPYDWEKAENTEMYKGGFESYSSGTLKLTGTTKVTKNFDAISGKFVFETYVLVPESADVAYINIGDVSVKFNNSVISTGPLAKNYKNHVWQCIHVEGDTNANSAKIYVNGKIQGEIPMNEDSIDNVTFKYEKKADNGYMYIDDVEVYNIYDYADYCPVPNPVNNDDEHTVIMSVCSLWREGTHYGWDYVSPWDETTPVIGFYDEGIPETADWETKIMVEHGVDAFQYCWYYGGDKTWKEPLKFPNLAWSQHDGYFYSKYSDMIKFCFMWENAGFTSTKMTVEQFKTYVWDYWLEWYFTDPRYLCIDNKPVLHIYRMDLLEQTFGSVQACNELMKFMREDILNYGFDGIIILCQTGDFSDTNIKKFTQMGADGVMAYAWGAESAEPDWLIDKFDKAYETVKKQNSHLYIVPTLGTGRNIMGWRNVRTPLATVEQHNSVLDYFKPYVAKQNIPGNMVYFGTWNEYGEGHWLAPSGLNGFGYADGWRSAYTNAPAVHDDVVPTINQQNRISKLYNDKRTPIRSQLLEKNEIPTVTVKKWDFENGATLEGFTTPFRYQSVKVENGLLVGVASERDPIIRTNDNLNIKASEAIGIKIVLRSNVNTGGNVFFITDIDKEWHSNKGFTYSLKKSKDGEFTEIYLDLTTNTYWAGTITQIRFDFIEEIGTVEVKSIEIVGPSDITKVTVDGLDLEYPLYYIEKTADEFYLVGDPDTSIYSALNMYYEWNRWTGKFYLKSANDTEFEFNVGSDIVLVNGKEKKLAKPFYLYDRMPVLPMKFLLDNAGHKYTLDDDNISITVRDFNFEDAYAKRDAFQFEFDIPGDSEGWTVGHGTYTVDGGNLIATAKVASHSSTGHDLQISIKDVAVNTAEYSKIIIRVKPDFLPNAKEAQYVSKAASLYFTTSKSTSLSEAQSVKVDLSKLTPDAEGYVIAEFDMTTNTAWTGAATLIRFDPTNDNGIYYVDYIRFVKADGTVAAEPSKPAEDKEDKKEEEKPAAATLESVIGKATLVYDMDFNTEEDENAASSFVRGKGEYKDGYIHFKADEGQKDVIVGIKLPEVLKNSANYDTAVVRLKAENWDRTQMFFMNEAMSSYAGDANATVTAANNPPKDAEGFFLIKLDLGKNENWAGTIKSIRLDPGDVENGYYIIDYVKFYKAGTTTNPAPAPAPAKPEAPSNQQTVDGVAQLNKEDVKTPGVIVNGDAEDADFSMYKVDGGTLEIVTEDDGNKAFLITPTTGQKRWMYFTTPFNFIPGAKYKIEADLKVISDEAGNEDIKTKITCNFRYQDTIHGHQNGYEHNAIIGKDQTPADGWVHMEGEYTVETMDANKNNRVDTFSFYCNPVGDLGCKFMIDNIVVTIVE